MVVLSIAFDLSGHSEDILNEPRSPSSLPRMAKAVDEELLGCIA